MAEMLPQGAEFIEKGSHGVVILNSTELKFPGSFQISLKSKSSMVCTRSFILQ
jgi:hypothetical protein